MTGHFVLGFLPAIKKGNKSVLRRLTMRMKPMMRRAKDLFASSRVRALQKQKGGMFVT